ncbi:MAG: VCBS repeat-containing protein, partial [Myxococcales bacterium]|nr:VCBS repeat-containing protein [Myxococcales bacterium]
MTSRARTFLSFSALFAIGGGCGDSDAMGGAPTDGGGGAGGSEQTPSTCLAPEAHEGAWFTEITGEVGLAKTASLEPLGTSVVAGDLDGDGWQDFYTAVFSAQREPQGTKRTRFLFMNRPDPKDPSKRVFVDTTDESGLLATRDGEGGRGLTNITFGDLDNDGDLDAIGCAGEVGITAVDPCAAFLNDGKAHFTLAPEGGDLEAEIFSMATSTLLDFDRDGILDFWPGTIGKWQYGDANVSHPRLYRGLGDGTFEEVSAAVGLPQTLPSGSAYRMNFGNTSCDLDLDGDRDMLVGNYGVPIGPNEVYRNDDGVFDEIASSLDVKKGTPAGGFTFSITCGDIDDDGDVDLMTSEVHHAWNPEADVSELLINETPPGEPLEKFVRPGREAMGLERPHTGGQWTEGDNIALFADIDFDGKKDILLASSNYPQQSANDPDWTHTWLYHQKEDRTFEDMTKQTPWGDKDQQSLEGPALVDIDNDGDLDLLIGTGTYNSTYLGLTNTVHAYRNEIGQRANWARIRVVGKGAGRSNRSGIGARVELTANGKTQYQEVLGSWGHSNTQTDVTL